MDLRNYYSPLQSNQFVWDKNIDKLCQTIYNSSNPKVTKQQYDKIMANSLDVADAVNNTTEANILIREIRNGHPELTDYLVEDVRGDIDSGYETELPPLMFKIPEDIGESWDSMFKALMKLRVTNKKSRPYYDGQTINTTISYGKPNHDVVDCQPNKGGCGLSALYAIGVISFDTFYNLLCNPVTLNAENGTIGNVLYQLALSRFEGVSSEVMFTRAKKPSKSKQPDRYDRILRKAFEIRYLEFTEFYKDGSVKTSKYSQEEINNIKERKINEVLPEIVRYLHANLKENTATLLRFGDRKNRTASINEASFGHSVVVYKHNGQCYIADFWLSSKLTFRDMVKNGKHTYTVSSWEKRAGAGMSAIEELNVETLKKQMFIQNHVLDVGTVFEIIVCSEGTCEVNSNFSLFKEELRPDFEAIRKLSGPFSAPSIPRPATSNARTMSTRSMSARSAIAPFTDPNPGPFTDPSPGPFTDPSIPVSMSPERIKSVVIDKEDKTMTICTKAGICTVLALTAAAAISFLGRGKTRHLKHKTNKTKRKRKV
jgi:hypothetical protein